MNNIAINYTRQPIDSNILSVLDITTGGKVVSASDWSALWNLVINRVNSIDAFCANIEELRVDWQNSVDALNKINTDLNQKYDAIANGFIYYGEDEPTNPESRLWVQPVTEPASVKLITKQELLEAMEPKLDKFTEVSALVLNMNKAKALSGSSGYVVERYRATADIKTISTEGVYTTNFPCYIPANSNITVVYSRNSATTSGEYTVKATVTLDTAWIVPPESTTRPGETSSINGYVLFTGTVSNGTLSSIRSKFYQYVDTPTVIEQTYKPASTDAVSGVALNLALSDRPAVRTFAANQGPILYSSPDMIDVVHTSTNGFNTAKVGDVCIIGALDSTKPAAVYQCVKIKQVITTITGTWIRLNGAGAKPKVTTITLPASGWQGSVSPYAQSIYLDSITAYSKIDLTPSIAQLNTFHDKDLSFIVMNDDTVLTVYCIGEKPTEDYIVQATITEVETL